MYDSSKISFNVNQDNQEIFDFRKTAKTFQPSLGLVQSIDSTLYSNIIEANRQAGVFYMPAQSETKKPLCTWKNKETKKVIPYTAPIEGGLVGLFTEPSSLYCIDFDYLAIGWAPFIERLSDSQLELIEKQAYIEATPHGLHLYFKLASTTGIKYKQDLTRQLVPKDTVLKSGKKWIVDNKRIVATPTKAGQFILDDSNTVAFQCLKTIETVEYAITFPTAGYNPIKGDLTTIEPISVDELNELLSVLRSLDEVAPAVPATDSSKVDDIWNKLEARREPQPIEVAPVDRSSDFVVSFSGVNASITQQSQDYNHWGCTLIGDYLRNNPQPFEDLLITHGFKLNSVKGDDRYFTRPGKDTGVSCVLSTNPLKSGFFNWSSNTPNFDTDKRISFLDGCAVLLFGEADNQSRAITWKGLYKKFFDDYPADAYFRATRGTAPISAFRNGDSFYKTPKEQALYLSSAKTLEEINEDEMTTTTPLDEQAQVLLNDIQRIFGTAPENPIIITASQKEAAILVDSVTEQASVATDTTTTIDAIDSNKEESELVDDVDEASLLKSIINNLTGTMAQARQLIELTSHKRQPLAELLGAMVIQSQVIGTRLFYVDAFYTSNGEPVLTTTTPNVYFHFVAPSGMGKDATRKVIQEIFAPYEDLAPLTNLASSAALNGWLEAHRSVMTYLPDNYGKLLTRMISGKTASCESAIIETIDTLYTSAPNKFVCLQCKADDTKQSSTNFGITLTTAKRRPVMFPHLSIYATSVPIDCVAINGDAIQTNGFLARFDTAFGRTIPERQQTTARKSRPSIDEINQLRDKKTSLIQSIQTAFERWDYLQKQAASEPIKTYDDGAETVERYQPLVICADDEAHNKLQEYYAQNEEKERQLRINGELVDATSVARDNEKVLKAALLFAASRIGEDTDLSASKGQNPQVNLMINVDDVERAIKFRQLIALNNQHHFDSFEKKSWLSIQMDALIKLIRDKIDSIKAKRTSKFNDFDWIQKSEITHNWNWGKDNPNSRDAVINGLIEEEVLTPLSLEDSIKITGKKGQRATLVYKIERFKR